MCLSLYVSKEEEDAQRHYKDSTSAALCNKLDRINYNDLQTNFNKFMKCFKLPIQVRTLEDTNTLFFGRQLQFMSEKELEKLAALIIQQQNMNSRLDLLQHLLEVMKYYFPPPPS